MRIDTRFLVITGLILLAILTRLIPHAPNFTAMSAVALFGSAYYDKKIMAFLVPLTAVFISDLKLGGLYKGVEWVYASYIVIALLGFLLRNKVTMTRVLILSVISSLSIYIISDFGVWLGTIYPHNWQGFTACYIAAIPFLRNWLLGDLFYGGLLFGIFYLAQLKFPKLLKQRIK
jgi:hypothetical protein